MTEASAIEQLERKFIEWSRDLLSHFRDCLQVRDHNTSSLVPFELRRGQQILHNVAEKQLEDIGYVRILLLKSRRFGGSTYVEGRFYSKTSRQENKNTFIAAHEEKSTATLFQMAKLFHQKNPVAPSTLASNAQELRFDNKEGTGLKSEYQLATAKNVDAGRSQGVHYLHICLTGHSLVVLGCGETRAVRDIGVGDVVVTGSGAFAKVKNKFSVGEKSTIRIKTWLNNQSISVTPEHKIFTSRGVVPAGDLSKDDWILIPKIPITDEIKAYHYKIPGKETIKGKKHQECADIPMDRGFGYYLGYYLAEGCIKKQSINDRFSNVHFAYHKDENFVERAYNEFAIKYCTSKNDYSDETERKRTYFYGTFLAYLTESICGRTDNKHIPEWFFKTNRDFLHGVVEGYLDGDGSKTKTDVISATCIREKIARQIRRICISLGYGVPSLSYRQNRRRYNKKTKNIYELRLSGDTKRRFLGFNVETPHKVTKYKEINGQFYVKIETITRGRFCNVYDIEVDHPDHNFETTSGVVSNSEEAYFPDGAEILLNGLMACLPKPPTGTEVFRESTANGYGNTFQKACDEAHANGEFVYYEEGGIPFAWHNPKSARKWVVVFIPWFMDETLYLPFDSAAQKVEFQNQLAQKEFDKDNMRWVESEAARLKRQYNLSLEQLHWRQYAIENDCGGDLNKFHQEYPSNFHEAFLSAGQNVFSRALCDDLEAGCTEPIKRGDLKRIEGAGKVVVKRNEHGNLSVWEECRAEDSYFITVDVAGGIKDSMVGRKRRPTEDPDFTSIDVWNHRTGNQAAQWHGHVDYDLVADIIVMIGELYGIKMGGKYELPTAAVELNNHGYTVVARLRDMKFPQYYCSSDQPGWQANRRTKPNAVDSLRMALRDGTLKINSPGTVAELRRFIEEGGKFAAAEGCNDDRVSSAYLAAALIDEIPRKYNSLNRKRGGNGAARFSNFKGNTDAGNATGEYEEYYV